MPALLLVSPHSRAGKTTIAAGLARTLWAAGHTVTLARLPGDDSAEPDRTLFAGLVDFLPAAASSGSEIALIEAPSGDHTPAFESHPDARAVLIASASHTEPPLDEYAGPIAERLAGVIINKAPRKRLDLIRRDVEAAGLRVLAVLPEDRLLAAPVLRDVAGTLSASVEHLNNGGLQPLDRPLIATVSADPGQGYFAGYDAKAVIVRSDKPDLQLAALNAGASCLILTGGLPLLSYVLERAEEDEIPLVRTSLDTISTVNSIEGLFGSMPFPGGEAKVDRISELLAGVDIESVIG